jgi:uncharacterized protein HemX
MSTQLSHFLYILTLTQSVVAKGGHPKSKDTSNHPKGPKVVLEDRTAIIVLSVIISVIVLAICLVLGYYFWKKRSLEKAVEKKEKAQKESWRDSERVRSDNAVYKLLMQGSERA